MIGRKVAPLGLIWLALLLRVYQLAWYPFNGDEYNTITEAQHLGLNWNSILYYILMKPWTLLGIGEFWLRFPSVVFGVLTVAVMYQLGRRMAGEQAGIMAAALAATSPFHLFHSQDARFYTFFILASTIFMLATVYFVEAPSNFRIFLGVCLAGIVLAFSHFLGLLVVGVQSLVMVVAIKSRWPRWLRAVGVLGLLAGFFLLPFFPGVLPTLWHLYERFGNHMMGSEPGVTPISILSLAKMAIAFYVFIFGYHVYPLWFTLLIPGLLLTAIFVTLGSLKLLKGSHWGIVPFIYALALIGTYTVLEAVGGRLAGGIAPRHVAFVWPVFILVIAVGLVTWRKATSYTLLSLVILINLFSLWPRLTAMPWSYTAITDYRGAGQLAAKWLTQETAILHDGRSYQPIQFYFPKNALLLDYWPYLKADNLDNLAAYQRLIVVTNDFYPERRQDFNHLLTHLEQRFTWTEGQIDYPLFTYILERKAGAGYPVSPETGQIRQPLQIYGLEFDDLRLLVTVTAAGQKLVVAGSFGLPNLDGEREQVIPLEEASQGNRLILLSNVVAAEGLMTGELVAEIILENELHESLTFPLRLGLETESWNKTCNLEAPCTTAYQWHKHVALVGQKSYPDAWRDFQAGLHATVLDLPHSMKVSRLTVRYLAGSGSVYIWALALPAESALP